MRRVIAGCLAICIGLPVPLHAQVIGANSSPFSVERYYYLSEDGGLKRFQSRGFFHRPTSGVPGKIVYLPQFSLLQNGITFIDSRGLEYDYEAGDDVDLSSVSVRISVSDELPTPIQLPSIIAATTNGQTLRYAPITPLTNNFGGPVMLPEVQNNPQVSSRIIQASQRIRGQYLFFERQLGQYSAYRAEIASLTNATVSIVIGNEVVASRRFEGALTRSGGTLPAIEVPDPTPLVANRIAQGNFDLQVSYQFQDSRVSSIDARINAKTVINQFLSEAQRSFQRSRASGFQFLGFGSRRKSFRSSFDQQITSRARGYREQQTVIVMSDATDDMIERFERSFFPDIGRDAVINNHLSAAEEARKASKPDLAKMHEDYARSLRDNDVNLKVDTEKALASLAANDFAGFLANGLSIGNSNARGSMEYRRLISDSRTIDDDEYWNEVRNFSVDRQLTAAVYLQDDEEHQPWDGICGTEQWLYPSRQVFNPAPHRGLMILCVIEGSPAHRAGLVPGMVMISVDGVAYDRPADYARHISRSRTGDTVGFQINTPARLAYRDRHHQYFSLRLSKGPPRDL